MQGIYKITNNKIVAEFKSIADAERATNTKNISRVCSGVRKSAGGYSWKYKE